MYTLFIITLLAICYIISDRIPKYRFLLICTNTLVCIFYISWRITVTPINSGLSSFLLGIALFSAELLGLISFFNFQFLFIKKHKVKLKTLDDFKTKDIPSVDILICTYNEPLYLLEKTIVACTNLDYPNNKIKIYVCDDGRRNDLKTLCSKYNINYLTRNNNKGAKAGNINNALKFTNGDLFTVLDADMIPKKDFLSKTVGYFSNENMAFVQTPQVYYNQDIYQYNLLRSVPNEQDFFMRYIQESRAARNAVLHVGTNAVFRKKYVENIGGYPTCSITEDMAVGMLLQANGYDSEFINEELVLGLSANTFTELVKQRDRWCRGNLQVLKNFNPLTLKGLNLAQRIVYLDGAIYWFSNLQKLIYIICPLIFLISNKIFINATLKELLSVYIPFWFGQYLIFRALSSKTRNIKWSHYYEIAMAPHLSLSILKELLSLNIKFNVTSKEIVYNKKIFQFKVVLPHILLVIATIIAFIISTKSILKNNMDFGSYLLNIFWSLFNLIGIIVSLRVAYQKPIFRSSERIPIKDKVSLKVITNTNAILNADLFDISEKGAGIKLYTDYKFNVNDEIKLNFKNEILNCQILRINNNFIGLKFKELSPSQMKLIMEIYVRNMTSHYDLKKSQEYIINNNLDNII